MEQLGAATAGGAPLDTCSSELRPALCALAACGRSTVWCAAASLRDFPPAAARTAPAVVGPPGVKNRRPVAEGGGNVLRSDITRV